MSVIKCCQIYRPLMKKLFCGLNNSSRIKYSFVPNKNISSFLRKNFLAKRDSIRLYSTKVKPQPKQLPDKKKLIRLIELAKPEKWKILGAVGFLIITSSVTLAVPYSLGKIIDIIYSASDDMKEKLKIFCILLFGVFLMGGLANFGRVYLMEIAGQKIIQRLRKNVYSSLLKQEVAFFDKNKSGELINRLSSDTTVVGFSVTMNISDGLRSLFGSIASISMMFYTSTHLALVGLCTFPPIAGLMFVYGKYLRRISKNIQDSLAESTQVASEHISNIRTVRAFAQEEKERIRYSEKINKVLELAYKDSLAKGVFFGLTGMTGNCIILAILYQGGMMMTDAQISVGELTSFLMYAVYVTISVSGMTSFYSELVRGLGASSRLWELVDRKPTIPIQGGLLPSNTIDGNISLENVTFSYPSRPEFNVFRNLNLDVEAGTILAVVGSSGSGKSTIASLILRYYDPVQGAIKIDGHNLKDVDPIWFRKQIGTVSQEPILFSGSIHENIVYSAENPDEISFEQVMEAANQANAFNFINQFPDKFDTLVGERGVMLSGGQRQRISIARAIISNPRILLLDEATSALDAESEHLVQEALERVMKDRTVITIAHRLSTIKNADFIAVLHDGSKVEYGTYSELMEIPNGMFQKLVKHQTIQQ